VFKTVLNKLDNRIEHSPKIEYAKRGHYDREIEHGN
jgi:hypothetical protein